MRLAVVTNILAPYRIPFFEQLSLRCTDFLVLLLADRHANRDWQAPPVPFRTHTLRGVRISSEHSVDPVHLNVGTWRALRRFAPDVVLGGGFTPAHAIAKLYCRFRARDYVPWGELTLQHPSEGSALRRRIRRWMIGGSRSFVASSNATRQAYIHYGAAPGDILVEPMPIGSATLRAAAAQARQDGTRELVRARHGNPLIVSAGRLVDDKGWLNLLRAFRLLVDERPGATLVIAGEGPQLPRYQALAECLQLGARVLFVGQLPARQLTALYTAADLFVFPTLNDPYGAVLAEAMACETLVVGSVHAASTGVLLTHEESGFIADPRDEQSFAREMSRALGLSPADRATMLARASARIPADDMQTSAVAIVDFLSSRRSPGRSNLAPPGRTPAPAWQRDVS